VSDLRKLVAALRDEYAEAADNPLNASECLYSDVAAEFAEALSAILADSEPWVPEPGDRVRHLGGSVVGTVEQVTELMAHGHREPVQVLVRVRYGRVAVTYQLSDLEPAL